MEFLELFANIPPAALVLFCIGVVLLIVEMHIPGFGAAGISALVAFGIAILLAADTVVKGLVFTGVVLLTIAVIVVVFLVLLSRGKLSHGLILKAENTGEAGFSSGGDAYQSLLGRDGSAQTPLRPAGRASIDGRVCDVVSSGEFIPAGTPIRVTEVNGSRVVVEPRS